MIGQLRNWIAAGGWTFRPSVKTGLTAAAQSTATGALQLTADVNVLGTVTSTNNSALLPPVNGAGSTVVVFNADSADDAVVFAAGGGKINNIAAGTSGMTLGEGTGALFVSIAKNEWVGIAAP